MTGLAGLLLERILSEVSGLWFVDENRGWAVGAVDQRPTIWETTNSGDSWAVQRMLPRAYSDSNGALLDVHFVDQTHGWAVGRNGFNAIILATDDGGRHWNTQYSGNEITGQFSRVQFADTLNGCSLSSEGAMQ